MAKKGKSSGNRNNDRPNGKSWKKNPKKPRKTGRTIGGYSPKKLEYRKLKRLNPVKSDDVVVS